MKAQVMGGLSGREPMDCDILTDILMVESE
jgi:hypothetical protein